ncbi:glucose 1-dehydrogenase [Nocardia salmonicida]|uniref:glucose 1-dehydrogenase n=1 Tax=Nocardia salmonicida TaxID=53431 RepID=UPI0033DF2E15
MDLGMKDKVALITGGESGIGRAAAIMFAEEGANVVIAGIGETLGKETVDLVTAVGGKAVFVKTDVRIVEELEAAVAAAVDNFGRLDYAVNSAGVEIMKPFLEMSVQDWDFVADTNLKGVWSSMRAEIPAMLKSGGGAIVNISSLAGLSGFPKLAPYVASKAGVLGLTKTVSMEFAGQGVRVNSVCPGTIDTPIFQKGMQEDRENTELAASMNPMGRVGTAEEVAYAVLTLCSEKAGYITGITVSVDGGWSQH